MHLANDKILGRVEFIEEKISGKVSWKQRKIGPLLNELKKGDTILLSEFSRLGRILLECMEIDLVRPEIEALLITGSTQNLLPGDTMLLNQH